MKSDVIKIPDNVSSPQAASAACALRTIMHGFELLGGIASHETIVIQGSGPIGLYALAVARDKGANRILVTDALGLAPQGGARLRRRRQPEHRWTSPTRPQRRKWVQDHTGGRGADIVIQCASGAAIPEGLEMTRQGGRFLSIGAGGGAGNVSPQTFGSKTYIGFRAGAARHYHQALTFLSTRTHIQLRQSPLTRVPPGARARGACRA